MVQGSQGIGGPASVVRHSSLLFYLWFTYAHFGYKLDACRWQFKASHFDSVLLFKMGKFYEMFEMDAHIGVEVLGLIYMKVKDILCCALCYSRSTLK